MIAVAKERIGFTLKRFIWKDIFHLNELQDNVNHQY
jgi:hypothetical protein